jgi:hypothetical protein
VLDDTGVLVLLPSVERDDIGALVVLAWLTSTGGGRERGSDGRILRCCLFVFLLLANGS